MYNFNFDLVFVFLLDVKDDVGDSSTGLLIRGDVGECASLGLDDDLPFNDLSSNCKTGIILVVRFVNGIPGLGSFDPFVGDNLLSLGVFETSFVVWKLMDVEFPLCAEPVFSVIKSVFDLFPLGVKNSAVLPLESSFVLMEAMFSLFLLLERSPLPLLPGLLLPPLLSDSDDDVLYASRLLAAVGNSEDDSFPALPLLSALKFKRKVGLFDDVFDDVVVVVAAAAAAAAVVEGDVTFIDVVVIDGVTLRFVVSGDVISTPVPDGDDDVN